MKSSLPRKRTFLKSNTMLFMWGWAAMQEPGTQHTENAGIDEEWWKNMI
jgi:hypothetical protein